MEEFYALAKRYCSFIDNRIVNKDSLIELTALVSELYSRALQLSILDSDEDEKELDLGYTLPELRIDDQIPNFYYMVFDPYKENDNCCGMLDDDLCDIYRDLWEGIKEYEAGHYYNAVFTWRWGVDYHWGNHVVDVLRALHWLRTDYL